MPAVIPHVGSVFVLLGTNRHWPLGPFGESVHYLVFNKKKDKLERIKANRDEKYQIVFPMKSLKDILFIHAELTLSSRLKMKIPIY